MVKWANNDGELSDAEMSEPEPEAPDPVQAAPALQPKRVCMSNVPSPWFRMVTVIIPGVYVRQQGGAEAT